MAINPNTLAAGDRIDGFVLDEKIHHGGMATLWRVTRSDIDFPVIMKIPRLKYGDDPTAMVGFEVEQMVMPKLTGPHVPRFVAAGDFTECPYIVMEYVPGPSLRVRMDEAPLPAAAVADIGARIATALHSIHRQHVVHLDLKPSNVLFRESGEVVLIDFGLAHHEQLPDLLTEEFRLPMGTGAYISPEQVLYVRGDHRSDLFALGVTLYYFATGLRPFGTPTSVSGLRKRLYRDPAPPRMVRPDCPGWLQEVILRCLEIDPEDRYESAAQVAFALQHPDQITLTARAERRRRDGLVALAKRWLGSFEGSPPVTMSVSKTLDASPIVMVALDLRPGMEHLNDALRQMALRIANAEKGARLTCVTVRRTPRVGIDVGVDAAGQNLNVQMLVELKHWAKDLDFPNDRISFHVLDSHDPAAALVEYARSNHVEHMVIGGRGGMSLLQFLGSVSSRVVGEAPCTVTVVRAHDPRGPGFLW